MRSTFLFLLALALPTAAHAQVGVTGTLSTSQDRQTGVAAGVYTCPTLTVDTTGRVTSVSSGTCGNGNAAAAYRYPGEVAVFPPGTNSSGCIMLPNGTYLSPATTTDCLQEGINAAVTSNADLTIVGGAQSSGGAVVYNLNATLVMPPLQGKRIRVGAATFNFTSALGNSPCWQFDSMMMVDFTFAGQVVCPGHGPAVLIKPINPVPWDHIVVVIDSFLRFTTIDAVGGAAGLMLDATSAPHVGISNTSFIVGEINGGFYNIYVPTPSAGSSVNQNRIISPHVHFASNTTILLGSNTAAPTIFNNTFEVQIATESANVRGIDIYAANNYFSGSVVGSLNSIGVLLESAAHGNKFMLTQIDGGVQTQTGASNNVFY